MTATSGTLQNNAVVWNNNEDPTKVCKTNNTMPAGDETTCLDPKNTDPAIIKISNPVSCNGMTATPSSGKTPLVSTLTCSASGATAYKIEILSGSTILQTINNAIGNYTFSTPGSYTAKCTINGSVTSAACTVPVTVTSTPPEAFDLSIKKFVGDNDAQTESSAAQIEKNSDFIYKIQVKNEGTGSTTGKTTVIDTLPTGVSLSGTTVDSDSGWTCIGTTTNALKCESTRVVAPGAYFSIITVKAKTLSTLGTVTNHAFVQNPDEVDGKQCKADGSMPSGSETACSEDPRNEDPAVIKIIDSTIGFDLSIKKYAKSEDVFAVIDNNEDFNYTVVVQNNGTTDTNGVTTMKDVLPEYITLRALPSGNGWDCSTSAAAG